MLMHAIAHGVCTDTVRESALKVGSGRKNLLALRSETCVSIPPVSGPSFVLLERPPRDLPDESLVIYFISYINVSL